MKRPSTVAVAVTLGATALAWSPGARAQTQSLAFTGGVLLNTTVNFRNLGRHASPALPGAPTGGAVNRTYDDGYNRVDATGNTGNTTANWGYQRPDQARSGGQMAMSQATAGDSLMLEDVGAFIEPSGVLEYRGSLGSLGSSDWGLVLGGGYQTVGTKESASFVTDATVLEDVFTAPGTPPDPFPAAPYSGTAAGTGMRLGSVPARTVQTRPGARALSGTWEFDAELIPITCGLYFETQIAGRLNAVVSAGFMALLVNAELKYQETSTVSPLPSLSEGAGDGTNDFVIGGFTQLGLDWAIWESASIVASARWQPAQTFDHSVNGRTAEIEFTGAFAVHAGFAFRF